jgi:hypothetical protein
MVFVLDTVGLDLVGVLLTPGLVAGVLLITVLGAIFLGPFLLSFQIPVCRRRAPS